MRTIGKHILYMHKSYSLAPNALTMVEIDEVGHCQHTWICRKNIFVLKKYLAGTKGKKHIRFNFKLFIEKYT